MRGRYVQCALMAVSVISSPWKRGSMATDGKESSFSPFFDDRSSHEYKKMNDNNLIIRYANVDDLTSEDYEEMADVSRAAFAEYKRKLNLNFRGVTMRADYLREQAKKGVSFINMYHEGKLIAYCGMELHNDSHGIACVHMQGIATHPQYRRLHLGRRLTQLFEQWGIEQGAAYFELNTSCKAVQALLFHRSNRYEPWAYTHFSTTNYYSVIMRKPVTLRWSEWRRRRSLVSTWIHTHLTWDEAGNRRRFGMAVRHLGGYILRFFKGQRG